MYWQLANWWQGCQRKAQLKGQHSWSLIILLLPLSFCYALASALYRRWCLQFAKRAPLGVLSIGSPIAGGSGKTPIVKSLASWILQRAPVAIISRGYGCNANVAYKVRQGLNESEIADEPWMLSGYHVGLPGPTVIIAQERLEGCKLAKAEGASFALLDDGMQHYKLLKDLEIAVISPNDYEQHLLPYGRLREPLHSLKRCHWVLIRGSEDEDSKLVQQLKQWNRSLSYFSLYSPGLRLAPRADVVQWQDWKHGKVWAFAGIAHPSSLHQLLIEKGLEVVHFEALADHQPLDKQMVLSFFEQAKIDGAQAVVCTEKDWARISIWAKNESFGMPLLWPEWQVQWQQGSVEFFQFLENWLTTHKGSK